MVNVGLLGSLVTSLGCSLRGVPARRAGEAPYAKNAKKAP